MKRILYLMTSLALVFAFASCEKPTPDDPNKEPQEEVKDPVAHFEYEVNGLSVTFNNKSTDATSYKWDFGDEETSKEANPTHEYAAAGTYTVSLTAANAQSKTNKKEATVIIAGAPKAYFSAQTIAGRAGAFGKLIKFDATSSANATSISWDFGDGETATEFVVEHIFPDYATYTVKATVSNEAGETDTFEQTVETIAQNELLMGGNFEEDDAQYWTFITNNIPDWHAPEHFPLEPSFDAIFGYTADKPTAGVGGCLRFNAERQFEQAAFNCCVYQAVELVEGDVVRFGLDMKWGENTNNDGLFWIGVCNDLEAVKTEGQDGAAVEANYMVEMFNYWGASGTGDWGVGGSPVPAYDEIGRAHV